MEESLNHITLPDAAIVDLYSKHLVVIEEAAKVEKNYPATSGNACKSICFFRR